MEFFVFSGRYNANLNIAKSKFIVINTISPFKKKIIEKCRHRLIEARLVMLTVT